MQPLKPGQLSNIKCESPKNTTLYTWVDEDVVVGELIKFTNYENYGGEWRVLEILGQDTYDNCLSKWGHDNWFLRKIKHIEVQQSIRTPYKE